MIGAWSPGQWALRVTMVLGVLVALASTTLVGVVPDWWLVLVVTGLALGFASSPESHAGAVAMAFVVVWWGVSLRDGLHPEALLAAAGLLASHVAGLLAAYGPDELSVDAATVRRWVFRGLASFLLAPAVWLVAVLLRDRPEAPGVWVAGLTVALIATVAASMAFTAQEPT
ncbi:MAG TPA: hypothetical protein VFT00_07430 [Nocardioides sp.]|nr:hypothetical protein [Nocardioides sp.]